MTIDLEAVLEDCWAESSKADTGAVEESCRWCHQSKDQGHTPDCPCGALFLALQQRDALAAYVKAEKRNIVMQGAIRLAKRNSKAEVKRRLEESALQLEAAHARLRELGIEEMVR
jgi:hypothetical protein